MTAGDVLVNTLIDWGVDTIFGIPGDGINGLIESLRRRKDEIRFIQVRHEEAAAFAACAYAKWTGRLGVCIATSGPGGIHLLNGLYDAKARSGAGARDHRTPVPRPAPYLHATGRGARQALHGRRRLQCPRHGRGPYGECRGARLPDRARLSRRGACHHAGRRAGPDDHAGRANAAQRAASRL